MRVKPSTYFAFIIMAVMVAMIGKALTFRYYQTALLPVIAGSLVFILAAIQAGREIFGKDASTTQKKPTVEGEDIEYTKGMSIGVFTAWFLGFCLAIYALGHLIAVPLFSLSYVKWRGKNWTTAVVTAAGITAFIYIIFPLAFRTELYPGLISELFLGE